MGQKKKGPTSSQLLGIVWLSVALVLIAGVVFFSSRKAVPAVQGTLADTVGQQILASHEDSAYRQRRQNGRNVQYTRRQGPKKTALTESMYTTTPPAPTKQPLVVELNSADTLTLQLLHGIGPALARRIVRYRERLGGFASTAQLLEVYGFTPALVDHIGPYLRLDTTLVKPIRINSIGLKQLARHPYVEYYQARDIVRLRAAGVHFGGLDDLRAVPSMADTTLARLAPYLDYGDSTASEGNSFQQSQ